MSKKCGNFRVFPVLRWRGEAKKEDPPVAIGGSRKFRTGLSPIGPPLLVHSIEEFLERISAVHRGVALSGNGIVPRRPRRSKNYFFFFAAGFLAAGFFAAAFLAMVITSLRRIKKEKQSTLARLSLCAETCQRKCVMC